jgi:predicted outer membrane repeat protein
MAVIGGTSGAVNGVNTVRTWTVTSTADLQAGVASNTKRGEVIVDGNTDWSGSYTCYGHTPGNMPGDGITFTGSLDGTNGVTGTAIIDSVEITIDIEAGAIIAHTVNFSGNGALTKGGAVATDATTVCPPSSIGCKAEIGTMVAVPVWSEISDVRTMTITITCGNQAYVSSATAGGTKRTAGNWSATVAITVYTDDYSSLPDENDSYRLRIYVDGSTFWLFEFVVFGETSDMGADIEGAAVVGGGLNARWNAYDTVAAACTEGQIVQPDTTVWWP